MLQVLGMVVALCAGCGDPQEPRGLRIAIPDPIVDLGVSDGCARFQVRFDAGGAPIVEPIFNSASCALNQIRLLSDTAATFDAATGALRVAIVMENLGTAAIVPRVQLRFNADSVTRLDANGNPVGGANDILGYQPDSASATGRIAFWRFDGYLAPAGQPQVLMPGARTQRRWVEFRGTTWSHRTRLKLFATGQEQELVPAQAPDSIPHSLLNRIITPSSGLKYYHGVLYVGFVRGTTQQEKARVVGLVNGRVVGGRPDPAVDGGMYLLQLPTDTSQATLVAAEVILGAQASVVWTRRQLRLDVVPAWRRPNDGAGWQRGDWRVRGDSLLSPNALRASWGAQFVRTPLGWGCSLADTAAHVAVIDYGFQAPSGHDMPGYRASYNANLSGDTIRHGAAVLSVIGSVGDNSTGITGVAWGAAFSAWDPTSVDAQNRPMKDSTTGRRLVYPEEILQQIVDATRAGATVISISLGADSVALYNVGNPVADSALRAVVGGLRRSLDSLGVPRPLLVLSAGNVKNGDVRGSFFPLIRDSLPATTIVVSAMGHNSTALYAPLNDSRIDLLAPGQGIGAWVNGSGAPFTGSSFATPLVSGAAALLKSFDPRLSADSLKLLLVPGAARRNVRVYGYPVLDAYEPLRLAAERPGAPLCGNRMWSDGNQLLVRRGTTTEVIGTSTSLNPTIESYHGGRVAGFGSVRFAWQPNGSWAPSSLPAGAVPSGSWRSAVSASHDGDSTVYTTTAPVPVGGGPFDVIVDHFAGASLLSSRTVTSGNAGANVPVFAHVAYPSIGDTALVSVTRGPTIVPPLPTPFVGALDAGTAYGLSLSTGQVSTLWSESGRGLLFLGYSEDGSEIVSLVSSAYSGYGQALVAIPSCKVTWRKASAPAVVIDSASTPYGCQIDPVAGARTGGSAPRIVPRRP
ncbi:MAG: S8 family serine peptidase [Gemmatimonadetes bacterium]|nr:S8 family serine peptidase [Gemmatimonadota bacterium]